MRRRANPVLLYRQNISSGIIFVRLAKSSIRPVISVSAGTQKHYGFHVALMAISLYHIKA